jgi:hypothetical protein
MLRYIEASFLPIKTFNALLSHVYYMTQPSRISLVSCHKNDGLRMKFGPLQRERTLRNIQAQTAQTLGLWVRISHQGIKTNWSSLYRRNVFPVRYEMDYLMLHIRYTVSQKVKLISNLCEVRDGYEEQGR